MRKEFLEQKNREHANALALENLVHTSASATKGTNGGSGALGRDFESAVKTYIGNTNGKAVSSIGRTDTRKTINGNRVSIEIKSGASEIATVTSDGIVKSVISKSDLVIYAPEYTPTATVECQAYVLDSDLFVQLLLESGLIRKKKSSYQYKLAESERWHDRLTIQSLNSRKKYDKMYDLLEQYGQTLREWKAENLG